MAEKAGQRFLLGIIAAKEVDPDVWELYQRSNGAQMELGQWQTCYDSSEGRHTVGTRQAGLEAFKYRIFCRIVSALRCQLVGTGREARQARHKSLPFCPESLRNLNTENPGESRHVTLS